MVTIPGNTTEGRHKGVIWVTLRALPKKASTSKLLLWQLAKGTQKPLRGACFLKPCQSFTGKYGLVPESLRTAFRDGLFTNPKEAEYVRDKFILLVNSLTGLEKRTINAMVGYFKHMQVDGGVKARTWMKSTTWQVQGAGPCETQYLLESTDVCRRADKGVGEWLNTACACDCGVTPITREEPLKFPAAFTVLRHE